MSQLDLLPSRFREISISEREIVLPMSEALEAIDLLEADRVHILGWEGWIQDTSGRVGFGSAPQGTASLDQLSVHDAAQLCRSTIPESAAEWRQEHPESTDTLHFCITVRV